MPTRNPPATETGERPRKPGPPLDAQTDKAIIIATLQLIAAHGVPSVEAVAAALGCSKATIYRRWASKEELVVDALGWAASRMEPIDTGSVRGDLERYYDVVLDRLSSGRVDVLPHLVQIGKGNPVVRAALQEFNARREEPVRQILQRGISRGEIPPDVDLENVMDALLGPLRYRYHFSVRPLDQSFARDIIDLVISGLNHVVDDRRRGAGRS